MRSDDAKFRGWKLKTQQILVLLIVCAVLAVVLTIAGGVVIYRNAMNAAEASRWIEHTHAVLDDVSAERSRLDRMDYNLQLYRSSQQPQNLRDARNARAALVSGAAALQQLVTDNVSQLKHVRELNTAITDLSQAMDEKADPGSLPSALFDDCRLVLSRMQIEERALLNQRLASAEQASLHTLLWSIVYVGVRALLIIVLFTILIRDVLSRRDFESQLEESNTNLTKTVGALGDRVTEGLMLKNARDELQLCVSAHQAYSCVARHFELLIPGSAGALMVLNNSRSLMVNQAGWNNPIELLDGFDTDICCGLRTGHARWRRPGESEIHCAHFAGAAPENYLCVPLAALGETMGFIYLRFTSAETIALATARAELIYEMVELAAMSVAGLNLRAKLENQSIRDGLTGLFNRHFMEISLDRELQRASRQGTKLALLMIDVDHFKTFNDTFGHEAGDQILRELAGCLQDAVRAQDVVCRYGGEEFVVLMPEVNEAAAVARADALRERVSEIRMQFRGETLRQISISVGVALYPEVAHDATDLLRMADRALYQAKNAGRNQIKLSLV